MKALFRINRLGAQDKSITYDVILTNEILEDITFRITGSKDYEVMWVEKRNEGRLITLETDTDINYINLSQYGHIEARNNYFQSVATALGTYLSNKTSKKCNKFYFYFLPFSGNNKTDYMKFFYRIMKTAGIYFLNPDFGIKGLVLDEFTSVKDIIKQRNILRKANSGNKSTYITDEGTCYHIYGKTFGANQKETTLLCIALSAVTDKPLKLFQILDNDSISISKQDADAIKEYANLHHSKGFEIMDDTLEFDDGDSDTVKDKLRSPKFIYNLLAKFDGEKCCALCGCKIDNIVQAAHIYPVASIRKREDLSFDRKFELATDGDNGIWLCENHHKLFDSGLIWFEEGKICISSELEGSNSIFVKQITTIDKIEPKYINDRMLAFFDLRAGSMPRMAV